MPVSSMRKSPRCTNTVKWYQFKLIPKGTVPSVTCIKLVSHGRKQLAPDCKYYACVTIRMSPTVKPCIIYYPYLGAIQFHSEIRAMRVVMSHMECTYIQNKVFLRKCFGLDEILKGVLCGSSTTVVASKTTRGTALALQAHRCLIYFVYRVCIWSMMYFFRSLMR